MQEQTKEELERSLPEVVFFSPTHKFYFGFTVINSNGIEIDTESSTDADTKSFYNITACQVLFGPKNFQKSESGTICVRIKIKNKNKNTLTSSILSENNPVEERNRESNLELMKSKSDPDKISMENLEETKKLKLPFLKNQGNG